MVETFFGMIITTILAIDAFGSVALVVGIVGLAVYWFARAAINEIKWRVISPLRRESIRDQCGNRFLPWYRRECFVTTVCMLVGAAIAVGAVLLGAWVIYAAIGLLVAIVGGGNLWAVYKLARRGAQAFAGDLARARENLRE